MTVYNLYGLIDPRTRLIRYVGYSKDLQKRYKVHLCDTDKTHKTYWIRDLQKLGLIPELKILAVTNSIEEAQRLEVALIARIKNSGVNLVNSTNGGDGWRGGNSFYRKSSKNIKSYER